MTRTRYETSVAAGRSLQQLPITANWREKGPFLRAINAQARGWDAAESGKVCENGGEIYR